MIMGTAARFVSPRNNFQFGRQSVAEVSTRDVRSLVCQRDFYPLSRDTTFTKSETVFDCLQ